MSTPVEDNPPNSVVSLSKVREDKLWAVVAAVGRKRRIAEVYASRAAADANCHWREQQVRAYVGFLRSSSMPVPSYTVSLIRRADLARGWRPMPALGFLRGQFI